VSDWDTSIPDEDLGEEFSNESKGYKVDEDHQRVWHPILNLNVCLYSEIGSDSVATPPGFPCRRHHKNSITNMFVFSNRRKADRNAHGS
jgi:hypothetical protein